MRTHKAIDLVKELIQSSEPLTRRNATAALSILATQESTALLLEVALTDKDPDVRERAMQELRLLGSRSEAGLKNLTATIHECMGDEHDEKTQLAAYALLSRFRSQGLSISLPRLGIAKRMRLAAKSRTGGAQPYYRPLLLGTVVASAAVLLFSLLVVPGMDPSELVVVMLFGSCGAPLATLFVLSRLFQWKPIALESDRLGGFLVDLRLASISGTVLGLLISVISLLASGRTSRLALVWIPIVSSIVLILTVRTVCASAAGTFSRHSLDTAFRTLTGTTSGIALITLVHLVFRSYNDAIASTAWLILVPISAGLAVAITGVDREEEAYESPLFRRTSKWRRASQVALGTLSLLVLSCAILAAWPNQAVTSTKGSAPTDKPCGPGVNGTAGATTSLNNSISLTPGRSLLCNLQVATGSQVSVIANNEAAAKFTFLWRASNIVQSFKQQFETLVFAEGLYTLQADPQPVLAAYSDYRSPASVMKLAGQRLFQRVHWTRGNAVLPATDPPTITIIIKPLSTATDVNGSVVQQHQWCWQGSLKGFWSLPAIKQACENAVASSGGNYSYLDSRGLNRALNGDYAGAIADFQAFANQTPDRLRAAERLKWINQLKQHKNPFTPLELSRIVSE
jgi:hypothetical protein